MEALVVTQKLSRELERYRCPAGGAGGADASRANGALYLHARRAGVHAWDLREPLDPRRVDLERYRTLLLRAAAAVLRPLGWDTNHPWDKGHSGDIDHPGDINHPWDEEHIAFYIQERSVQFRLEGEIKLKFRNIGNAEYSKRCCLTSNSIYFENKFGSLV